MPGETILPKPPKWKMAVLTFAGVYALTVLIEPFIDGWPLVTRNAVIAAIVVGALTWLVMPRLTRLVHGWLFPPDRR